MLLLPWMLPCYHLLATHKSRVSNEQRSATHLCQKQRTLTDREQPGIVLNIIIIIIAYCKLLFGSSKSSSAQLRHNHHHIPCSVDTLFSSCHLTSATSTNHAYQRLLSARWKWLQGRSGVVRSGDCPELLITHIEDCVDGLQECIACAPVRSCAPLDHKSPRCHNDSAQICALRQYFAQ